jgi:hypothetical protein
MFKGNIAQRPCANDLRHSWFIRRDGAIDIRQRIEANETGPGEGGCQEAGGAQMLAKDEIKRPARGAIQCAIEAQLLSADRMHCISTDRRKINDIENFRCK